MRNTLTTIMFVVLIGMTPSLFGQESAASFPVPADASHGLNRAEAQISGSIGEDDPAYHVFPQPEGFRMKNGNHGLSVELTPERVDFHQGARDWGMALRGYGYGETLHAAGALTMAGPGAIGSRVPAADDHDTLASRRDRGRRVDDIPGQVPVLLREKVHRQVHATEYATGNLKLPRLLGAHREQ